MMIMQGFSGVMVLVIELLIWQVVCVYLGFILSNMNNGMKMGVISVYFLEVELINRLRNLFNIIIDRIRSYGGKLNVFRKLILVIVINVFRLECLNYLVNWVVKNVNMMYLFIEFIVLFIILVIL